MDESVENRARDDTPQRAPNKMLFGQVGVSEVLTSDVKQHLGLRTGALTDGSLVAIAVSDGSPSFRAGLRAGDHITSVDRQGDIITLSVERAGRVNSIQLSLSSAETHELSLRVPRLDNSAPINNPFQLNAEHLHLFVDRNQEPMFAAKVSETARFLSRYDVELIVDASMSMRRPDCPGAMSRWTWCGAQSLDLARQLSPFANQGITLTSFNRNFYVYEHQNPEQLTTLFMRTQLAPNTRLAEPLADRLNDYLIHSNRPGSRPRLIAVITDGVPHPPEQMQMVEDVLIHASNMIRDPRQLTVVFFQIGSRDFLGQQFLSEIDNNLVARGAHFDIVQTVSFEHLRQVGLAQGLADAIRSFDYNTRN
ncbi:MAG TPA: hypothetical protein V6C89_03475 [Drouetiella sp.]